MTCSFCGGVAHPATGCVYGASTIACGPCAREFWRWYMARVKGNPIALVALADWAAKQTSNQEKRP